jgi:hypothetical protein
MQQTGESAESVRLASLKQLPEEEIGSHPQLAFRPARRYYRIAELLPSMGPATCTSLWTANQWPAWIPGADCFDYLLAPKAEAVHRPTDLLCNPAFALLRILLQRTMALSTSPIP